ncbi:putative F-box protein At3g10240 [Brassica rapa]|uniref:putative F-box protein At3g10240 n=1 Tax=Brassica campestris TaxID=3711 RepID=UPI00142DA6D3|nr:putative F-box protein At3g10240 [Brassica rapa]
MAQQPTSGSSFPSDLTLDILLRLPAKSVWRFRCVSKLWLSITTDPCFIKSFGTTRPSLLLCSIKCHNFFVTSTPQHTHHSSTRSYSSSQTFHCYPMKLPGEKCYFSNMDSVHGLICIEDADSKKPVVWNPSTNQLLHLPKPNMSSKHANVFLGYDSVEGKHKVVCLPYKKTCYVCRVFTLRSGQESWRTVKTNLKHRCIGYASGQCIKGVIYYLARNSQTYDTVIMSFGVLSEIFRMIELPSGIKQDVLISYEGRLACIDRNNNTRLWILEDADKHKWSFQDFFLPLNEWDMGVSREEHNWTATPYLDNRFKLKGCTHAGEFIYVTSRFHKSSYIVFYDPVRNSCKIIKFEGIVDGLTMHAFPNHIESLMSL